ncbi:hypothetical protein AGABI2DRAFT_203545 [Agaricus bisporus var. bisporus H97]|uniref:hypothetical protein n=1 Tax=Agaricus bisporus var. bisporus (strain H97 / ATCC MYA-4626 / FGSC 10389) TaxID=936046 RepID=UPI00029F51C4|nr:hypothetical protein AGABI2DRAFT_203545 [Agaricus bisporus var. bisporus H97]EKV48615.1 hypothetical protein AGABI2DRAFT_203545 [Agaricus bisporus var. bisporus H97]
MPSRGSYQGSDRKLLLAFDVGTTYSGISYSILDPGKKPEVQGVYRFPGQEVAGGTAKLPSIIYYSQDGGVRAVGAEAEGDSIEIVAEEEDWVKVEWFKLHLCPKLGDIDASAGHLKPLPLGKTVVHVLTDFMKYLNTCAKQWIQEVHPGIGSDVWDGREIHYVLSHPNGWEGPQRTLMRQAAENASLVPPNGRNQLSFITEGEASLNRCIEKELLTPSVIGDQGISIVDAGGGTIDISAYARKGNSDKFAEIAEAQCHFKGSIFVSEGAEAYLQSYLPKSNKYYADIPQMKHYFDKSTKCAFRDPSDPLFIRFGSARDKDPKYKITAGKLRLEGTDVASFFEPSIKCIVDGILAQRSIAHTPISHVFLVGGFAANDYLFKRVEDDLEPHGLRVYRPDAQINKVVADGAILGVLDNPVRTRVSRYSSGVKIYTRYNKKLPEHRRRRLKSLQLPSGYLAIPDTFEVIIKRNVQVSDTQEFRSSLTHKSTKRSALLHLEEDIICYRGNLNADECQFMDNDPGNYHKLCTVKAYLGDIHMPLRSGSGGSFYEIEVDIVLLFGVTELKAQIAWIEKGEEKRGPARIIYDTNL